MHDPYANSIVHNVHFTRRQPLKQFSIIREYSRLPLITPNRGNYVVRSQSYSLGLGSSSWDNIDKFEI